jgi:hypothetical protein
MAGFEKRLVIKRLRPELARRPAFRVDCSSHEAKLGVHLNHPNVVQVFELGKRGRQPTTSRWSTCTGGI